MIRQVYYGNESALQVASSMIHEVLMHTLDRLGTLHQRCGVVGWSVGIF